MDGIAGDMMKLVKTWVEEEMGLVEDGLVVRWHSAPWCQWTSDVSPGG